MAYISYEELKINLSERLIIQLTDDNKLGQPDMAKVDQAIAKAMAEVDGYCVVKYPDKVPFKDPVPEVVKTAVFDITIYRLFCLKENMPENRLTQYKSAVATLRDIAGGRVGLGIPTADIPAPNQDSILSHVPERIFSSDSLSDY
ncbi:MAG: DUF1320 domain-containing protein [Geobacteraceae bacterium]|nr:DUF1320 domain-containing protein [Geobacteraceae bacterium]